MERIKALDYRQKWILLILAVMVLVFSVLYPVTLARVGFSYQDTILVPGEENGNTVYSGKIQGKAASFTVTPDKTVTFQHAGITYGPYTVTEDPSAVYPSHAGDDVLGVVVRQGEEILFRGSYGKSGNFWLLYNADGSDANIGITFVANGNVYDEYGNVVDPMEPSVFTILSLIYNPDLTHKGHWIPWVLGILLCVINAVSILFADELFRFWLSFRIESPELVEPTDWEIMGRYFGWVVMTIGILVVFILGLS